MFVNQLLYLTLICHCTHSELVPVSEEFESMSSCALSVADTYFIDIPNINYFSINTSRDSVILSQLYTSKIHGMKLRNFITFQVDFYEVTKRYTVIAADSLHELMKYKQQFQKLLLWNARSRYLFVIRRNSNEDIDLAVAILWDNYIINAVIMMPSVNDAEVIEAHSWFPYENGACGSNVTKSRLVDVCVNGSFVDNVNLYPEKVPKYLNGCPVRAQVIIWPPFVMPPEDGLVIDDKVLNIINGVEILMMQTIAQFANFTLLTYASTVPHDWGLSTVQGNVTGTIKVLFEKRAELGFGAFGPTAERRMYCDYSASHTYEALTWCVPIAQLAARWRNLLDTFQYSTWVSMIGAYLMVSFISWSFCSTPPRDLTSYVRLGDSLNCYFSLFLAVSVSQTPIKVSGRIMFFVWIVFGLHFVAAYQAKLISKLLHPVYDRQLSTLDEILTSGMEWASLPTLKRFYANTDDWRVAKVIEDWRSCDDAEACLHRIAYKRDFALCILNEHVKYELLQYTDSNSRPLIHCFPSYLTYPSEMYMTKGFPLKHRIDKLIYRIKATGLIAKWQRDMQYLRMIKNTNKIESEDDEQKLTLSHLQGAFMILGLGIVAACAGFIGENIYYVSRTKIMRRKVLNQWRNYTKRTTNTKSKLRAIRVSQNKIIPLDMQ